MTQLRRKSEVVLAQDLGMDKIRYIYRCTVGLRQVSNPFRCESPDPTNLLTGFWAGQRAQRVSGTGVQEGDCQVHAEATLVALSQTECGHRTRKKDPNLWPDPLRRWPKTLWPTCR